MSLILNFLDDVPIDRPPLPNCFLLLLSLCNAMNDSCLISTSFFELKTQSVVGLVCKANLLRYSKSCFCSAELICFIISFHYTLPQSRCLNLKRLSVPNNVSVVVRASASQLVDLGFNPLL